MPPKTLTLCHPPLLPPTIFYRIRIFSNELVLCIRWPKYWRFSFTISPSNEYSGLISFGMNWLILQSKGLSRVFSNTTTQKHKFFGTQLLYIPTLNPYMTTGKTIVLTRQTFVSKVMPPLFNTMGLVNLQEEETERSLHTWRKGCVRTQPEGSCPPAGKSVLMSNQIHWHPVLGLPASRTV